MKTRVEAHVFPDRNQPTVPFPVPEAIPFSVSKSTLDRETRFGKTRPVVRDRTERPVHRDLPLVVSMESAGSHRFGAKGSIASDGGRSGTGSGTTDRRARVGRLHQLGFVEYVVLRDGMLAAFLRPRCEEREVVSLSSGIRWKVREVIRSDVDERRLPVPFAVPSSQGNRVETVKAASIFSLDRREVYYQTFSFLLGFFSSSYVQQGLRKNVRNASAEVLLLVPNRVNPDSPFPRSLGKNSGDSGSLLTSVLSSPNSQAL